MPDTTRPPFPVRPMAPEEIRRQITTLNCPFVFRIVDNDKVDPGAGTAVLVSDTSSDYGYALTCWHNIDWYFVHTAWHREPLVKLKRRLYALPGSESDLLRRGEPLELMGQWSNPTHDLAVLRVSRSLITRFGLRPAPISFHVRKGAPVVVRGFDRPWLGASLASYEGHVPGSMDPFTVLHGKQRAFTIWLKGAYQRGLSGGGVFDIEQGALIGVANAVKPETRHDPVTPTHRETGYAASLLEAAESWTEIRSHCQVVVPRGDGPRSWPLPPCEEHMLMKAQVFQPRPQSDALREFWAAPRGGGVLGLVGDGGTGKTALVADFLQTVRSGGARPARDASALPQPQALFVWSFYEDPHAEKCLDRLFGYLAGDDGARTGPRSLSDLQARIAGVHDARVLIVLDGIERVQSEKTNPGRLRDDAVLLRRFLQWCGRGDVGVWVVTTSRLPLADLEPWADQAYRQVAVDRLPPQTSRSVLKAHGVNGSEADLEALGEQFGAHALTMNGLGVYLGAFHAGRLDGVAELQAAAADGPLRARGEGQEAVLTRLLAGFEHKLQPEDLSVMKAISAFRIPVDAATVERAFGWELDAPAEERLHLPVAERLDAVLARLCALQLLHGQRDARGVVQYTAHPAIGSYFYRALEEDTLRVHLGATAYLQRQADVRAAPDGGRGMAVRTRGALRTRGAPLRGSAEQRPTDAVLLDLLEEAVYHAIRAGRVTQAWELYRARLGGFEHLRTTAEGLARGCRITEMFLQHFDDATLGVDADGREVGVGDAVEHTEKPLRNGTVIRGGAEYRGEAACVVHYEIPGVDHVTRLSKLRIVGRALREDLRSNARAEHEHFRAALERKSR